MYISVKLTKRCYWKNLGSIILKWWKINTTIDIKVSHYGTQFPGQKTSTVLEIFETKTRPSISFMFFEPTNKNWAKDGVSYFCIFLKADSKWKENWGGSILEREPSFQKCLHVGTWKLTCCFVHILLLSADRNRSSKIFQQFKIVVHSKKKGSCTYGAFNNVVKSYLKNSSGDCYFLVLSYHYL